MIPTSIRRALLWIAPAFLAGGLGGVAWTTSFPDGDPRLRVLSLISGLSLGIGVAPALWLSAAPEGESRSAPRHTYLLLGAGSSLILGVACVYASFRQAPGDAQRVLGLICGALVGLGFGLFAVAFESTLHNFFKPRAVYFISIVSLGITIPLFVIWCGMRHFGGFDHSVAIEIGWRIFNGQRPFKDFPLTMPIGFVLGSYYAFALFGVYWHSLILILAVFSFITLSWSSWLLAQLFASHFMRFVLAFALQALCVFPASFWWYNPITSVTGVLFVLSAYNWLRQPRSRAAMWSYGASLFLLATMKPNVAGVLIILSSVILVTSKAHRLALIVISGAALVAFLVWLRLYGVTLHDCVRGYHSVAGRAFELGPFFADPRGFEQLVSVVALIYVLLPLAGCVRIAAALARHWRPIGIALAAVLAGLVNFGASGESKLVDLGLVLFGIILLGHAVAELDGKEETAHYGPARWLTSYVLFIAITLSSAGLAVGATRHRVRGIGMFKFFEHATEREPFATGFFRGLYSGRRLKDTYAEVESIVTASAGRRIFFGPRMQWGYAAFRLPSPVRQPPWWQPGSAFAFKQEPKYVKRMLKTRNDVLIFLKDDMTDYPPQLVRGIQESYSIDQTLPNLTVYRRRTTPPNL